MLTKNVKTWHLQKQQVIEFPSHNMTQWMNEWTNEWFSFPSNMLLFLFYFLTITITNTKGNSYSNHTSHCWLWCRCLPAHSCNSSTLSCLCVIGKASQFIRVCTLSRDNFPGLFQDFKYTWQSLTFRGNQVSSYKLKMAKMPIKKYQQFQLILDSKLQRLSNTRSPHPELSSLGKLFTKFQACLIFRTCANPVYGFIY